MTDRRLPDAAPQTWDEIGAAWAPYLLAILRIMTALLIETVGGWLLLVGLFTRPAAFVLAGEMAVGYFLVHAPLGIFPALNAGELAILFCFIFLYMAAAGPGAWSIDEMRTRRPSR